LSFFNGNVYGSSNEQNITFITDILDTTNLDTLYDMVFFPYLLNYLNASSSYAINAIQCASISQQIGSDGKPLKTHQIGEINCNNLVVFQNNLSSLKIDKDKIKRIEPFTFSPYGKYKVVSLQYLVSSTNIFDIKNWNCGLIGINNQLWSISPINCQMILMFFKQ
jgi:hypothetical protein